MGGKIMPFQIEVTIADNVQKALAEIGRTEDVKFSPDNRCIAIAGFLKNQILIIDIQIDESATTKRIILSDSITITSTSLKFPHGLCFINNQTLSVANRGGEVIILALPDRNKKQTSYELSAIQALGIDPAHQIKTPGSLIVIPIGLDLYDMLVCNNYTNKVTRHILDGQAKYRTLRNEILLNQGLDVPDGVAADEEYKWIAISNHNTHNVLIFKNDPSLNLQSKPEGTLKNVKYPHGICFTKDSNFILAADAGGPYVHIYAKNGTDWKGDFDPIVSIRTMDDHIYLKGNYNPQEGGPKGLDITNNMNVFVTTCDQQTIAFFDLEKILDEYKIEEDKSRLQQAADNSQKELIKKLGLSREVLIRELFDTDTKMRMHMADMEASHSKEIQWIHNTHSWKITAPLRRISSFLRNAKIIN